MSSEKHRDQLAYSLVAAPLPHQAEVQQLRDRRSRFPHRSREVASRTSRVVFATFPIYLPMTEMFVIPLSYLKEMG
jgi:hypothetical protein